MNIAIITGASSGMGYETALQLDRILQRTDELWLIARNTKKLKELKGRLRNNVRIIPMDLTDPDSFETFSQLLEFAKPQIRFLINCAGFGFMGTVEEIPMPGTDTNPVEKAYLEKERRCQVREAVAKLDEKYRIPVYLYYTVQLSVADIAEVMKLPTATVKNRLHRARKLLKKELEVVLDET